MAHTHMLHHWNVTDSDRQSYLGVISVRNG